MNIKRNRLFVSRLPMKTSRRELNEQKHKFTTKVNRPTQKKITEKPRTKINKLVQKVVKTKV